MTLNKLEYHILFNINLVLNGIYEKDDRVIFVFSTKQYVNPQEIEDANYKGNIETKKQYTELFIICEEPELRKIVIDQFTPLIGSTLEELQDNKLIVCIVNLEEV